MPIPPNKIKYSTSFHPNTIKVKDWVLGINEGVEYGPTSVTGFWNSIIPPSGGYTMYGNKAVAGPSIVVAQNDSELIGFTQGFARQTFSTANEALGWYTGQTGLICVNLDYPDFVTSGLTLLLDAGYVSSYPRSGSRWDDLSFSGNNGTLVNTPTFSSDNYGYLTFNGNTQYVNVGGTPLGLSSYTKNIWFYLNGTSDNNLLSSDTGGHFMFFASTNKLYCGHSNWGNYTVFPSVTNFSNGVWYNACVTFDTTNGFVLYVNGVQDSTYTAQKTPIGGDGSTRIGEFGAGGNLLNGRAAVAMTYNRVLSSTEVLKNYNAFSSRYIIPTPTPSPTVTPTITPTITPTPIDIGCGSLLFSLIPPSDYTADQYLTVPVEGVLNLNTATTFTVESWIYPTSSVGDQITVFGDIAGYTNWWSFSFNTNNNTLRFYWIDNVGGKEIIGYNITQTIPLNTWTNVALSINSGTTKMFINGVELGLTGDVVPFIGTVGSTGQLQVGNWVNNGTNRFNLKGNLTNLRVNNTTSLYTSTFTPSYPLTSVSGTTLLLLTDGNSPTSDSSGNNVLVINNGGITWEEKCVTLPTPTPTPTTTNTPTPTNTKTPTPSITPTITPTQTNTQTPTPSVTPTLTPSSSGGIVQTSLFVELDATNYVSGSWTDETGNGNNATVNGATWLSTDGGIFDLNGSSNFISIPHTSNLSLNTTTQRTIQVWVKFDVLPALNVQVPIFGKLSSSFGFDGYWGGLFSNGGLVRCVTNGTSVQKITNSTSTVSIDTWYLFTFISQITSTANTTKVYINTTEYITTAHGTDSYSETNPLYLGYIGSGISSTYLNGKIGACYFYTKGLSLTEVTQNYNATKSKYGL